jgi:D-alanine-D-alanine ligase
MRVLILYNAPRLAAADADAASERGVLASVEAIDLALVSRGHMVARLAVDDAIDSLLDLSRGRDRSDVVVNFCEGFAGDSALEANVAALLELLQLPYTGTSAATLSLTRDKWRAKRLLGAAGLPVSADLKISPCYPPPTAGQLAVRLADGPLESGPWFVKPRNQDASLGIGPESVVVDHRALAEQAGRLLARYGEVLVEPYIDGREFNVSVIDLSGDDTDLGPRVLPLAEVYFAPDPARRWPIVTYDAKWSPESSAWNSTPVICPAKIEPPLADRLRRIAAEAFRESGCRDYARVDFRVDPEGRPWILEVNANPDLDPAAGFARSVLAAGISYEEFACQLIESARRRGPSITGSIA